MLISSPHRFLDFFQIRLERLLSSRIAANRQRAFERPDQGLQSFALPIRSRRSYDDLFLTGILMQHRSIDREQHHS
ncbi:hypothetical protein D3C84_824570 [compost metagenome]